MKILITMKTKMNPELVGDHGSGEYEDASSSNEYNDVQDSTESSDDEAFNDGDHRDRVNYIRQRLARQQQVPLVWQMNMEYHHAKF